MLLYIHGKKGRLGQAVTRAVEADSSMSLLDDLSRADVVIDFSSPAALAELLEKCEAHQKPLVMGTTGHSAEEKEALQEISSRIPVLYSPNFSLGMAVCLEAVERMAEQLGDLAEIEIVEAHRREKRDQPSGTALALAQAMKRSVPIHSIRAGDIVGDHTVYFILAGERIELKHQVHSRDAFARGAVRAAKFLKSKGPGLYSVKDIFYG